MLVDGTPSPDVERRVVFMTDMMPNTGATGTVNSRSCSRTRPPQRASHDVHRHGAGRERGAGGHILSGIRGANHYFIHSATEFERRLGEEFDYMVTPLVYDLNLDVDADGYGSRRFTGRRPRTPRLTA